MEQKAKQYRKNSSLKESGEKTTSRAKTDNGKQCICPVASKCGGCRWINRSYQEQLDAKETRVRKLLEPYVRTERILRMENPANYRNKVHAAFGEDRRHNTISGIYEEKSHKIVPVDACYIENRKADEIIVSIRGLLKSFKIRPYNEDTGYGLLRHVLIRPERSWWYWFWLPLSCLPRITSSKPCESSILRLQPLWSMSTTEAPAWFWVTASR